MVTWMSGTQDLLLLVDLACTAEAGLTMECGAVLVRSTTTEAVAEAVAQQVGVCAAL